MTKRAVGTFEVQLATLALHESAAKTPLGRRSIDKTFSGGLAATSKGEMLSIMGGVKGSAGYVALEFVTGTLEGKTGSFALQHTGIMNRGLPSLQVTVVPDSATGELVGLSGNMNIIIEAGQHSYVFEYELPV